MWRFAIAITLIEILLSALAAALFTMDFDPEPYLTAEELRGLNFPHEGHATRRRIRFDELLGYDSEATLLHPKQSLWVGVRVNQTRADYDARRRREENWATKASFGTSMILDDPGPKDVGFTVRHRRAPYVRCELVRFMGDRMLIVKVSSESGPEDEALAACERRARVIQARMLSKLRGTSRPVTAADRR
jgi:hypothetical protein